MTIETPVIYMQAGTYPARLDRFPLDAMFEEGTMSPLDCVVSQRAAGASFTVDVAVGGFVIQGDDQALQGKYLGRITATENVAVTAAPGANSRYDLVTLRVNDPNAGGNTGSTVTVVIIAGTASATPSVPALPASSLPLAVIGPITSGTGSITNSIINDCWTGAGPAYAMSCRLLAGRKEPVGTLQVQAGHADRVSGWLYCNGAAVSRTTYAALFAMISTSYGPGDGSTTFNLPDYRDRVMVSSGFSFTRGQAGGEINHTLTVGEMPSHNHTGVTGGQNVDHNHSSLDATGNPSVTGQNVGGGNMYFGGNSVSTTGGASVDHNHGIFAQGGGSAHNNMQPYVVMSGIMIKF